MTVLVTGSAGHLGEALVRAFRLAGREVAGIDILESPFTSHTGSIVDRDFVARCMAGVETILHSATLHKPHVGTHSRQDFIDTNITGTLNLLEEAVAADVKSFVFTSTTSVFGDALIPPPHSPTAWITEDVAPIPKNIYGVTKASAEDFCQLFHRNHGLSCVVLRTSRFFPEEDDNEATRHAYADANIKANEFLFRRVDIEDVVNAHMRAAQKAPSIGFARYIISATTPFSPDDLRELRTDAPQVLQRRIPRYRAEYERRSWRMFPSIDRVYVNDRARNDLGWQPKYDFHHTISCLAEDNDPRSPLACVIGSKGYHAREFDKGPYPLA
ncbi:MAG: NAD(P)-dependent oxidoreductase [Alphaproteobacteria bacterium]|nr:NAD(P)-dependent oxidoreductase [Alphaproteobacteria bacterium]